MKTRTLCALPLLLWASWGSAAQPLTIVYRDKPPYSSDEEGGPKGILIDKGRAIFKEAGIEVEFVAMPQKRITTELATNKRPICTIGWYRLPERELIGPFSLPLHQDKPQVVLASARAESAVRAHVGVKALLLDPELKFAVVDGVSYGAEFDALVKDMPRPPMRVTVAALQLARMIAADRADYMLIDQEDFEYLDRSQELSGSGIKVISFPDLPPGLARHLWCSKSVAPAVMKRIDDAIHKLGYDKG